jgi:hypothetical protein
MKKIDYQGWTEIFMHPVPRGIPILETTAKVTAAINKSRAYLAECLKLNHQSPSDCIRRRHGHHTLCGF